MIEAVFTQALGGPDKLVLGVLPRPVLSHGMVRIGVRATSIAFIDLLVMSGKAQVSPPIPYAPGVEVSGVILEVSPGVTGLRPGQRVMAALRAGWGGLCAEAVAPAQDVFVIPDQMDFVTAGAFPHTYETAHSGLTDRAGLQSGEWLLVLGAGGGVGLPAVDIGAALGARVIAAASSAEKLMLARDRGAEILIDYSREDLRARVKAVTGGRGADVVYDPVGGDRFATAMRCVAEGGRIVLIGFASGDVQQIPANYLVVKTVSVLGGSGDGMRSPARTRAVGGELLSLFAGGQLKPHVSAVFPLADFRQAFELLESGRVTGRIVLTVDGPEPLL